MTVFNFCKIFKGKVGELFLNDSHFKKAFSNQSNLKNTTLR